MDKTNEVLKQYFTENEIKEIQSDKKDKYKELSEKISKLGNKTQIELANLKQELENLSLDEKINKVLNLVEKSEKNQEPTKEQEKKAKKDAEEKGFSWEKISKIVEKKGGWFSWAGISAGIGALFDHYIGDFFGGIFGKIKDEASDLMDSAEDLISGYTKESIGTFEKKIYKSKKGKFYIKFDDSGFIKEVNIGGKKYILENSGDYKYEMKDGKHCLVNGVNVFPLDYIGWNVDKIGKDFDDKVTVSKIDDFGVSFNDLAFWNGDLNFIKKSSLDKIDKNSESILISENTKIYFKEKIDTKKEEQLMVIEKIEINGQKYELSMIGEKDLKFNLIRKYDGYYIDYGPETSELKISEIHTLINKKGYKLDENSFSLYKLVDNKGKIWDNIINFWEEVRNGNIKKYKLGKTIIASRVNKK